MPLRRLRPRRRAGLRHRAGRSRPATSRAERLAAYQELRKEAASAARRADEHARRTYERGFTKAVKAHVKQKPSNQP